MNNVNLMGRIVNDLELKNVGMEGIALLQFSIAVDDGFGDNKKTFFFDIKSWRKQAEIIAQYFSKGDRIGISGKLVQETWETDGQKKSRVTVQINDFDFIEKKGDSGNMSNNNSYQKPASPPASQNNNTQNQNIDFENFPENDDDIPF